MGVGDADSVRSIQLPYQSLAIQPRVALWRISNDPRLIV